jgi:CRP-like cAMP-binding protein
VTVAIHDIASNQEFAHRLSHHECKMSASPSAVPGNRLLSALPAKTLQALVKNGTLAPVELALGEVLHEPGAVIERVYFPEQCVISLLAAADGRMSLEVGLAGREGMAGIAVAMGSAVSPVRSLVQRNGRAMRLDASRFRLLLEENQGLKQAVSHYAHGLLVQATQAAFCSHYHLLESRLARALLMMRDRVHSNALHLTHEFLAHALGVRRVGITKAATSLQQKGLISYSRGDIRILDVVGLEEAACSCYEAAKTLTGA